MILDNKSVQVYSTNTRETHIIVDARLVPGLYHAKLEEGSNFVSMTKFYLQQPVLQCFRDRATSAVDLQLCVDVSKV